MECSPALMPVEDAPGQAEGRLVLVVDDNEDIVLLCRLCLRAAGFDVLEADSGSTALVLARDRRPAAVLLDFMLPDMDGTEVLQALRSDPATAAIPVIMLTARADVRDEQAAWELGVFDYITKPFDRQHLLQVVDAAIDPGAELDAERRRNTALQRLRIRDVEAWQRLAAVLDHCDDAVIAVDKTPDGIVTGWNVAADRLFGYGTAEVIGRPISVLAPADGLAEIAGILQGLARGERIDRLETALLHQGGARLDVSLSAVPIRDRTGKLTGAIFVIRDLTARHRADARLQALVETAPDAMVIVGERGGIELVNGQTERLFGYDRSELVGRPVEVLMPRRFRTDHVQKRIGFMADPAARPMGAGLDLYGLRKDGTEFPAEISLGPLRTGDRVTVTATIREVTGRKGIERMFRALVESAPDAMVIVNGEGRIRLVNAQTERLFGYDRSELVDRPVEVLVPPQYRLDHARDRAAYMAEARLRPMGAGLDLYGLRKDGSQFPVEISLSPLEYGEARFVSAAIRDVTDRKQVEQARADALQREREASGRLRDLDRLRDDFLSTVSHELRTPLTTIKGFAEVLATELASGPGAGEEPNLAERIVRAARQLDTLMGDLLDFIHVERGQLAVRATPQVLAGVTATAVERAAPALEDHDVLVVMDDQLLVMADSAVLCRALEKLLSNAAKFSPAGSTITVSAKSEPTTIAVSVTDEGPGIPAGEVDRIFDPFYRAVSDSRRSGTGIGLAIVKEFTEAQGGRVDVSTTEGSGSTFTIHLPRADAVPCGN